MGKYRERESEMSAEEAKAFRASLFVPTKIVLSDTQKREKFRLFWAGARKKYGAPKGLDNALWAHLKSIKHDEPEKFEDGIKHFGLKKKAS